MFCPRSPSSPTDNIWIRPWLHYSVYFKKLLATPYGRLIGCRHHGRDILTLDVTWVTMHLPAAKLSPRCPRFTPSPTSPLFRLENWSYLRCTGPAELNSLLENLSAWAVRFRDGQRLIFDSVRVMDSDSSCTLCLIYGRGNPVCVKKTKCALCHGAGGFTRCR